MTPDEFASRLVFNVAADAVARKSHVVVVRLKPAIDQLVAGFFGHVAQQMGVESHPSTRGIPAPPWTPLSKKYVKHKGHKLWFYYRLGMLMKPLVDYDKEYSARMADARKAGLTFAMGSLMIDRGRRERAVRKRLMRRARGDLRTYLLKLDALSLLGETKYSSKSLGAVSPVETIVPGSRVVVSLGNRGEVKDVRSIFDTGGGTAVLRGGRALNAVTRAQLERVTRLAARNPQRYNPSRTPELFGRYPYAANQFQDVFGRTRMELGTIPYERVLNAIFKLTGLGFEANKRPGEWKKVRYHFEVMSNLRASDYINPYRKLIKTNPQRVKLLGRQRSHRALLVPMLKYYREKLIPDLLRKGLQGLQDSRRRKGRIADVSFKQDFLPRERRR